MPSALLPPNATALERMLADTPELDRLTPEIIATLWDAGACPVANLPWLAWALSVDDWDENWPEATQRAVIAGSIAIHRKKGTRWAVSTAVAQLGYGNEIVEWWQQTPRGTPGTFRLDLDISQLGITLPTLRTVGSRIDSAKAARSHYTLRMVSHQQITLGAASVAISRTSTNVLPFFDTSLTAPPCAVTIGAALCTRIKTEVRPL